MQWHHCERHGFNLTQSLSAGAKGYPDPDRDWHRSNVTALANKIGDDPVLFSLLEVFDGEPRYLRPPEATVLSKRSFARPARMPE